MQIDEVKNAIVNQLKVKSDIQYSDTPCVRAYLLPIGSVSGSRNREELIGKKSFFVRLGWYISPLQTYVYGQWCFDDDGKLIDVVVSKEIDGI